MRACARLSRDTPETGRDTLLIGQWIVELTPAGRELIERLAGNILASRIDVRVIEGSLDDPYRPPHEPPPIVCQAA